MKASMSGCFLLFMVWMLFTGNADFCMVTICYETGPFAYRRFSCRSVRMA